MPQGSNSNGNTPTIAIVGLIVIIVLLALYFYTDLSKRESRTVPIEKPGQAPSPLPK